MERYELGWVPSPDNFVEQQQVIYGLNGSAPAIRATYPSNTNLADLIFETGDQVSGLVIRTVGDNGKFSDTTPVPDFIASNEAIPRSASQVTLTWKEHTD